MVLGRLMRCLEAGYHSLIWLIWLTKLFVLFDVLSFKMQGAVGGMMAQNSQAAVENGERLVLGGLWVHLFFFSGFVVVAVVFHVRIASAPARLRPWLARSSATGDMAG